MIPEDSQFQSKPQRNRRWAIAATVTVIVAAGLCLWTCVLEDRFIPRRFGVVEQGLIYRSGQLSSALVKKVLARHNIRVIVDLTTDDPNNHDQQAEKLAAAQLDIKLIKLPLKGNGTGDVNNYARAITAIADAEKNKLPVLVHCAAGTQRTGGVIAAYLLLVQKKDPDFVINELKRYGWKPNSNPELLKYLNNNMAELARLLKQTGVIDEIPSTVPVLSKVKRPRLPPK
jgi:protein tyrosine/serine phosphatase